jgi:outer membrane protein OmpA-like peptidoglycan-associated protein
MLSNTKVTPDDLRSLADQRAQAVRSYLETQGKIPLDRIF